MRSLVYAMVLLAIVAGAMVLLRATHPDAPTGTMESLTSKPRLRALSAPAMQDYEHASPVDLVSSGTEMLALWQLDEATHLFEHAVALDSTWYPAWVRLMECYSDPSLSMEDSARDAWARARKTVPNPADTLFLDGLRDLFLVGDFDSAVRRLEAAGNGRLTHPDAPYFAALALFRAGRAEEAARKCDTLLARDPTLGRALELRVRCALAAGDVARASSRARELARIHPDEPYPYVLLAHVELSRGDVNQAAQFCNNALQLDPACVTAVLTRAWIFALDGNADAARANFEKLYLFDDPVLHAFACDGIAAVEVLTGNLDAAVEAMDEAVRLAMLAGSVRLGLALAMHATDALCELGRPAAAETMVQRWVGGFGEIPILLGRLRPRVLAGELGSVERTFARMDSDSTWGEWIRAMGIDRVELEALLWISQHDYSRARERIARTDAGFALSATGMQRRAFVQGLAAFEDGDAEVARESFALARRRFIGAEFPYRADAVIHVQSLYFLGECAMAAGDEEAARSAYESFVASWGEASWELPAVERARKIAESLQPAKATQ